MVSALKQIKEKVTNFCFSSMLIKERKFQILMMQKLYSSKSDSEWHMNKNTISWNYHLHGNGTILPALI